MVDKPGDDDNDENELTRYVLNNHCSLMTELELRIIRAITAEQKADASQNAATALLLRSRWGSLSSKDVALALEAGPIACRRKIKDRLLRDHADQIQVNRCPHCLRVARTPTAQQCFWCGYDWH